MLFARLFPRPPAFFPLMPSFSVLEDAKSVQPVVYISDVRRRARHIIGTGSRRVARKRAPARDTLLIRTMPASLGHATLEGRQSVSARLSRRVKMHVGASGG